MTHYEDTIARLYAETSKAHEAEHQRCEQLDGAVPEVRCSGCDERFGYHVGHGGDWRTCEQGWCAPVGALFRTVDEVPDDEPTGACSLCSDYLYGEDETYGPYTGSDAVYCYSCSSSATAGVR